MAEQLSKLSPHRDLQCYFFMPSAIAALSNATASGFTLSGKWRQQQDWAVVEWNVNNTFEHPSLRYLPDGDLSGLVLTYEESRINCIPFESNLFPIVDWPNLRMWFQGETDPVALPLWPDHVAPVAGTYNPASATMTLASSPGTGNRVGLALLEAQHYYTVAPGDSLLNIATGIAASFNTDPDFAAVSTGSSVTVTLRQGSPNWARLLGANGNRISMYGFSQNGSTCWQQPSVGFSGGTFPTKYKVTLDFGALKSTYPTDRMRKMRWTWAADLQSATFVQTEYSVVVSAWQVSGTNATYLVAGPQSRRIEDTDPALNYDGTWNIQAGNYSGSRIGQSVTPGSSVTLAYSEAAGHDLYFGTRLSDGNAVISVSLDNQPLQPVMTELRAEDTLARFKIASVVAGSHSVTLTHAGNTGESFWFDFIDLVYPNATLPQVVPDPNLTLATDWDTYHAQSLPAERTAWLIQKLGFYGRVNHYVGALWFYELVRTGTHHATQTFNCSAPPGAVTGTLSVWITSTAEAPPSGTAPNFQHLLLADDTPATIVQAIAALINVGTNLIWAAAAGTSLIVTSRYMGAAGNGVTLHFDSSSSGVLLQSAAASLSGGIDGQDYPPDVTGDYADVLIATAAKWRTDLTAAPRLNRAARDWHRAYFAALKSYGIDCVAAFSTELMNGDPSVEVGIAQRYPDGTSVIVSTPAVQTNFSPAALAYWKQVYLDMAQLQVQAGAVPYLQSGEVQWWYFPNPSGMPLFDAYTLQQFQAVYGRPMRAIPNNNEDPAAYSDECAFAPSLIAAYTAAIRSALQSEYPGCRYEVLYPTDTNNTSLNTAINFAATDWIPANLTCLKTESFTFTNQYNLDQSAYSVGVSASRGFSNNARSHLVGISDSRSPWMKEVDIALSQGLESIVLFALDQYCLIGYPAPPFPMPRRAQRQG